MCFDIGMCQDVSFSYEGNNTQVSISCVVEHNDFESLNKRVVIIFGILHNVILGWMWHMTWSNQESLFSCYQIFLALWITVNNAVSKPCISIYSHRSSNTCSFNCYIECVEC